MSKRHILFLILLAMVLGVWRFLDTPRFADVLLNFITAGEVPVTHYIMTPDDTIRLVIGLFVITVFVVFRKEFMAAMPKRRKSVPMRQQPAQPPVMVRRPVSAVAVPAVASKARVHSPIVIKLPRMGQGRLQRMRVRCMHLALAFAARLAYYLLVATDGTRYAWAKVKGYAGPKAWLFGKACQRHARRIATWTAKTTRSTWRRALPHLKAADRQIEMMLRQNKKTATFTLLFDEGTKMGMSALRKQSKRIRKAGQIVTARVFKG